ncbi:MAG: hypothetical protein ACI3ZK_02365 [Candidatus Cryptobacteroides sp.]
MKKVLFALCIAAVAAIACQKPAPEEDPKVTPKLTLAEGLEKEIPQEGKTVNVEFTSNVDWKAALDVDESVATLDRTSGPADVGAVKLTVLPFEDDNSSRNIVLTLTPEGGEPATVTFSQSGPYAPYFSAEIDKDSVPAEGGKVTVTVDTNTEWTYTCSDGITASVNGDVLSVEIGKNATWENCSWKVTLTVPAIKDEEGESYEESYLISQDSYAQFAYVTPIAADARGSEHYSLAIAGDYLVAANGSSVVLFNKADGTFVKDLEVADVWAVANDDAGNILLITGSGEETSESNPTEMHFWAIPSNSFEDNKTWVKLNSYVNSWYGYGLDNPTVRGNLFEGDAVVTMITGGAPKYGGHTYLIFFQYKDGKFTGTDGNETDYVTCYNVTNDIYNSKTVVAINVNSIFDNGVLYAGYDGEYKLWYNPGTSGSNWTETGLVYGDWSCSLVSADIVEFDGKKLYIGLSMSFFPCSKNEEGVLWGTPSHIEIIDIESVTAPSHIAEISYFEQLDSPRKYCSASLQCEKEGNNLAVYILDGGFMEIRKLVLSPLN